MKEDRRRLLGSMGLVLVAPALAQGGKAWRIGFLGVPPAASYGQRIQALRAGLRDFGYIEGKNLVVEWRWAEGRLDRLPGLAAELVRLNVDLIVTHTTPSTMAAKKATSTIPIVIAAVGDPVSTGLVQSLARPGGNVTGLTFFQAELTTKRLEIIRQTYPRARRVGLLTNPANPSHAIYLESITGPAKALKLDLQLFAARAKEELDDALASMAARKMEAAVIVEDPVTIANARQIAEKALALRMPIIGFREIAEGGGLMAYGVDLNESWRRAGFFIDRVLKGAKPAELPIERASKFEMIVNLRTAKILGVRVPQVVLQGADRVIE